MNLIVKAKKYLRSWWTLRRLRSWNPRRRARAAVKLGQFQDAWAVMSLVAALSTFTLPLLRRGLSTLSSNMDKASAYTEARGIDPATLDGARLAHDMLLLSGQVPRASDEAKKGVAQLTGVIAPVFADTGSTLEELEARIAKTLTFRDAVTPIQFEGAENRTIALRFRSVSGTRNGHASLPTFLLPAFSFHIGSAHGLLRHSRLQIGKAD